MKRIWYTLDMTEELGHVSWRMVDGNLRDNRGSWLITPDGDGSRVVYTVELDVGFLVPNVIVRTLLGSDLPSILQAVRDRVATRQHF